MTGHGYAKKKTPRQGRVSKVAKRRENAEFMQELEKLPDAPIEKLPEVMASDVVYKMLLKGYTLSEIADHFGTTYTNVQQIYQQATKRFLVELDDARLIEHAKSVQQVNKIIKYLMHCVDEGAYFDDKKITLLMQAIKLKEKIMGDANPPVNAQNQQTNPDMIIMTMTRNSPLYNQAITMMKPDEMQQHHPEEFEQMAGIINNPDIMKLASLVKEVELPDDDLDTEPTE